MATINRDSLIRHVTEVVRERAPSFRGPWGVETPLGPSGAELDSVGCLEVILELEGRLGIMIRDENLTADTLATIGSLVDCLAVAGRRTDG